VTTSIRSWDDRPTATAIAMAAACTAVALGFALGYNQLYGGAALAVCIGLGLIILAPRLAFLLMLFLSTGWPYFVGIPIGRDIPVPFMVPIICVTFLSVVVRELLGLGPKEPSDPRMRLVDIGGLALTGALVVSIVANDFPEGWFRAIVRVGVMPMLLYICCRFFVRDAESTRAGFNALLLGSCVGSLYADYEWFAGYNPLLEKFAPPVGDLAQHGYWTATLGNYKGLYRSHGFGMNPIFFGATSAMLLTYAAARVATAQTLGTRMLFLALGAVCGSGLVATFSRGPILAGAVGLVILAVAYKSLRIYVVTVALAGALLVSYNLLSENSILKDRLQDNDNVTLRMKLWETAFAMFTDHPTFGVGLGAFPAHQNDTIRQHAIGPFFEMGDGRLETVKTAEHAFLQFLAEAGLVGAVAAALLLTAIARIYIPAFFRSAREPARMYVVAAGTGFVVFLAIGMTVTIYNSWEAAVVTPFFLAALINVRWLRPQEAGRGPP